MKKILTVILIYSSVIYSEGYAQVVQDPILKYYQSFDNPTHISPEDKIYVFETDFTGDGKKSVFITNDLARLGPHGTYGWSVYYPLNSGGYQGVTDGIISNLNGPNYIGYVAEIKRYGIVEASRNVVSVQYLSHGKIKMIFLGKDKEFSKEDYPQYFAKPMNWNIQTYTLAQLAQKYPAPATK